MQIYMLIKDADNINIDNIFFVTKRNDADKMVECGEASYYEKINVLSSIEVGQIYLQKRAKG